MTNDDALDAELLDLLAAGRNIEAIKRYREATGAGLAEAKAAVEGLQRGESLPPLKRPREADLEQAVLAELERGGKIAAIKVYRAATRVGLKDAKDAVEAIAERHGLSQFAKSGCASIFLLLIVIPIWSLLVLR